MKKLLLILFLVLPMFLHGQHVVKKIVQNYQDTGDYVYVLTNDIIAHGREHSEVFNIGDTVVLSKGYHYGSERLFADKYEKPMQINWKFFVYLLAVIFSVALTMYLSNKIFY
jgi:hypothetical protein